MSSKRHTKQEIARKLQRVQEEVASGATVGDACRKLKISEQTYYRWRSQYREFQPEPQARPADRLAELKAENCRLKRLVADLALQLQAIKDDGEDCPVSWGLSTRAE